MGRDRHCPLCRERGPCQHPKSPAQSHQVAQRHSVRPQGRGGTEPRPVPRAACPACTISLGAETRPAGDDRASGLEPAPAVICHRPPPQSPPQRQLSAWGQCHGLLGRRSLHAVPQRGDLGLLSPAPCCRRQPGLWPPAGLVGATTPSSCLVWCPSPRSRLRPHGEQARGPRAGRASSARAPRTPHQGPGPPRTDAEAGQGAATWRRGGASSCRANLPRLGEQVSNQPPHASVGGGTCVSTPGPSLQPHFSHPALLRELSGSLSLP